MLWVFTAPYPELQTALEEMGQEVVLQDRNVVGRKYADDIEYPYRKVFDDYQPRVMVFPDLWDGRFGYERHAFNKWRGQRSCLFVGCEYRTTERLSACRASLEDCNLALFNNAGPAEAFAKTRRTALWRPGEPATPILAALRDIQQGKAYRALNEVRHPYRNP